ncbi:hypothetical protein ACFV1C_20465 [Streptomyces sp. NPDC059605]|uniref:hypothetical protein n=1 Tax=unclassified Streptomyces TaxID=2593676 RepID=UPI00367F7D63
MRSSPLRGSPVHVRKQIVHDIHSPHDLRALPADRLEELAEEIRTFPTDAA